MTLRFEPPPDPLTVREPSVVSHVIDSDALQRLTKEIERYGRRELAGRSILIAGHRGIGKTTLVRKAIENARGHGSSYPGRPLFVDLHGPDLLAPPEPQADAPGKATSGETTENGEAKASGASVAGKKSPTAGTADPSHEVKENPKKPGAEAHASGNDSASKQPSGPDLQSFVERLTFSLYRAAAKEFVESFRTACPQYGEYRELVEQFALELDGSTDLGRIRLLYERVNAVERGVLYTSSGASGSQELALLAASSQAYRIVSGTLEEDQHRENTSTNTLNWSIAADNLLPPVTGLLTGGLAWAALPGDFGPLAKLFTSFTAGLASAIALKFTRTVQREWKQSSKLTFVPERNRRALRRLLPVLVDRFCDVGLPPIFVVDELDKVQHVSERMEALMGFLKQFVTERAFFCFLVDRDYYENLEAKVSTRAFPIEATLFGDRLFVQYAPEAAHTYLKNITNAGSLASGESKDDAARDLEVLPYVLLRRSFMHPFDLRREISRSTNAKNEFRFPPRALFNVPQYRNEVYYQVAVECVLAGEKLVDFAEDPNRAQLLYDTLYYPIRTKKLPAEFDVSWDKLKKHLADRMTPSEEDLGITPDKLLSEEDLGILHDALLELVRFLSNPRALLDKMQALKVAKYLPQPRVFPQAVEGVIEAAAGPKPAAVASPSGPASQSSSAPGGTGPSESTSVPASPPNQPNSQPVAADPPSGPASQSSSAPGGTGPSESTSVPASPTTSPGSPAKAMPLLVPGTGADKYRWQFDNYGHPLQPITSVDAIAGVPLTEAVPESAITALSGAVVSLLSDFEDASMLATKQGTAINVDLWERMRLIPTPPTWSFLGEAAEALRSPASLPRTKVEEYGKALLEYRSNLQSALESIGFAVAIAATMTLQDQKAHLAQQERQSLEILADVLAEESSRDQMLKQLAEIANDAVSGNPLRAEAFQANASYSMMLNAIEASANTARQRRAFAPSDVALQSADFYEKWFVQFYEGRRPKIDALWPFLSFVMGSMPFGLRKINPLRVTIAEWTPSILGVPNVRQKILSLERLGFRRDAEKEANLLLSESRRADQEDQLLLAMLHSIRNRGYEKATVRLKPLEKTLTLSWLPSESIACRLGKDNKIAAKYILVEIDDRTDVDQIRKDFPNLATPSSKVALFGLTSNPAAFRPFPFIVGPQSLDDLVERLDARPESEWADPKSAA